jgi:DNA-binding transcriptional ArsR family regulator
MQATTASAMVGALLEAPAGLEPTALANTVGATLSNASMHLRVLERVGLVEVHRSGRSRIYTLRSAPLFDLGAYVMEMASRVQQPPAA